MALRRASCSSPDTACPCLDAAADAVATASAANWSDTGRRARVYIPAGLQHIAFASADVLATARGLRERGVAPLAIPANYYDDLAARCATSVAAGCDVGCG